MAKPIAIVPVPSHNKQGKRDELLRKLEAAPLEHADAMLALWELLESAHQKQLLETARGALEASDLILTRVAEAAANKGAIQGMRNGIMLLELLGSLDPDALHQLVKAMPNALHAVNGASNAAQPPSLWSSLRGFASKDGRRALGALSAVAVAIGKALSPAAKD